MKNGILIAESDPEQCRQLCRLLDDQSFEVLGSGHLQSLHMLMKDPRVCAVIIDLDQIVDEAKIKAVKQQFPALVLLGLSSRRFHPELETLFRDTLYACMGKPVDPKELTLLLESGTRNQSVPQGPPP